MPAFSPTILMTRVARHAAWRSCSTFLRDVGHGMLEVSHNTLALVGFVLVAFALFGVERADLRQEAETWALNWLQSRQPVREEPVVALAPAAPLVPVEPPPITEPDAVARATASDPRELNRQQAAIAVWLSRRYRVAPEPVSRLVQEAWHVGDRAGLDPTLILAIMAIESSFNPFAQSSVGAQGLMQVMTKVHDAKYEAFGGNHAAFDPVTNVRVGVQVLKECITRAGSLEAGLRSYVGAGSQSEDSGYAGRVLSEQSSLRLVAAGKAPPARPAASPVAASPAPVVPTAVPPPHEAPKDAAAPATAEDAQKPEQLALLR